jgi:hypothetical protein
MATNYKKCTKCGSSKVFDKFYKKKSTKDGLRPECKECTNKVNGRYRTENKEKLLEIGRLYRESHREELREKSKQYREENKDDCTFRVLMWRKENPEKYHKYRREYYQKNKDEIVERNKQYESKQGRVIRSQRRRSRKLKLPSDLTESEWLNVINYFNNACCYCGESPDKLQQDHFVPVSKGGGYTASNIVPACASCNMSKSNNNFLDWYKYHPGYSDVRLEKIKDYLDSVGSQEVL